VSRRRFRRRKSIGTLADILENVVEHLRRFVLREEPFAFELSKKVLHRKHDTESAAITFFHLLGPIFESLPPLTLSLKARWWQRANKS
jgi:hypothetical protein